MFYLDLFRELEAKKIRYLLVGGLAMNMHGVPRVTMDVDIILAMDEANLLTFVAAARALGLKPVVPVALGDLLHPAKRRAWVAEKDLVAFGLRPPSPEAPIIDILIDPPIDVPAALARACVRTVGNIHVPLASIEDMIRLKEQSARAQDLADVEQLRRVLKKERR